MTCDPDMRSARPNSAVMRTPRTVDIGITSRCNLRCKYCYFFDNEEVTYEDLPTEAWLRFFEELGRCAVMKVSLDGGEPFIREDLPRLLEGIVEHRMRFSILSNGSLIDDERTTFIATTGRCDHVQVSVDGSCAEVHDACRGRGSFEGAIRGIHTLQRHGVPVLVRVTVNHHNVHDLSGIARLLLEELGLPSFSTNAAGYLGSCRQHSDEVQLSMADRQLAMEHLVELNQQYPGRLTASAGPLYEALHWREMAAAQEQEAPRFKRGGFLAGCGCHQNKMAVRADGVMLPCNMLPHLELGRINVDPLDQVWQQNPILSQLRRRSSIPLTSFTFCEGCSYISYCTGNCPALASTLIGEVDHPSPDACLRRFLAQGGQLVRGDSSPRIQGGPA